MMLMMMMMMMMMMIIIIIIIIIIIALHVAGKMASRDSTRIKKWGAVFLMAGDL